ncbi:MAG TPA: aspartyl protease family protein [Thermoplasmata archaeon]|nr:aspartyl protease family protein [Thermoplasmata archaeon]
MVDTGASYTVIHPQMAKRLGLGRLDSEELRTAKDKAVPGFVAEADVRVGGGAWIRRHLVFVPDEALREDSLFDHATGRMVRAGGLLGASTLQEGRMIVDFETHSVRPRSRHRKKELDADGVLEIARAIGPETGKKLEEFFQARDRKLDSGKQ